MITLEFMQQFTDNRDCGDPRFGNVFYIDGGVCATDTKILVFAKNIGVLEGVANFERRPNIRYVLDYADKLSFSSIPLHFENGKKVECEHCKGTGRSHKVTCTSCDGTGEIDFGYHDGYWYDDVECKRCDGDGYTLDRENHECEKCNGSGYKLEYLNIGGWYYDLKYLRKIPEDCTLAFGETGILYFKNDEIDGALMNIVDTDGLS
jgi:RecJ-like exonuclease